MIDRHDLARLDAVAQAELVASGELGSDELVDAALARIEELEPAVHALASLDADRARRSAATAAGPLQGVPFLVKDVTPYPGLRCAFGARLFDAHLPAEHSALTRAYDAAGLVTLGKSTTSELGLLGSTECLLEGPTRNPWALDRSATGSSGGAAAAVAAGMVPVAHANDAGGSIRLPAAACGLVGLKPSRGRTLPAGLGEDAFASLVSDHVVSRTVRDSALLLTLTSAGGPTAPVDRPPARRLRIARWSTDVLGRPAGPDARSVLEATAATCADLGHELVELPPPALDGAALSAAFFDVAGAAMAQLVEAMAPLLQRPVDERDLEPFTLALVERHRRGGPGSVARAEVAFADATRRWLAALDGPTGSGGASASRSGVDVVLTPTTGEGAPPLGFLAPTLDPDLLVARTEQLAGFTAMLNVVGAPGISLPLGTTADGLPLGAQFAARPGHDDLLLALALELEAARPWADRWPPTSAPALARASAAARGTAPARPAATA